MSGNPPVNHPATSAGSHPIDPAVDPAHIDALLGPGGAVARLVGQGYEERPAQLQMARHVLQAVQQSRWLIVEAGTGTGKTLAYLAPLLAMRLRASSPCPAAPGTSGTSGHNDPPPVVISTATRALQDQIIEQDVPLLRRVMGVDFAAVALKGRTNYLCLHRLQTFHQRGLLLDRSELEWLRRIEAWSRSSSSGDREELTELPDSHPIWPQVSATSDQCTGQACPQIQACFLTRIRRAAQQAELVVVNHHLLFADLAVKEGGFGEILPGYRVVVFDEAHRIPDVATRFFGLEVSNYRLSEIARDTRQEFFLVGADDSSLLRSLDDLEFSVATLRRLFPEEDLRQTLDEVTLAGGVGDFLEEIRALLERLHTLLEPHRPRSVGMAACARRVEELLRACRDLEEGIGDPGQAHWCETRGRGVFLRAAPLDTGIVLQEALLNKLDSAIFTSATLTTTPGITRNHDGGTGGEARPGNRAFQYIMAQLGLQDDRTDAVQLPIAFDYPNQALLYIPSRAVMPEPDHPDFTTAAIDEIRRLIDASGGRALCLFTSMRMLYDTHAALADTLPYPLLVQGARTKQALLHEFRTDTASVLLGSSTFWEGVDVPGEALSLVIIDRLPFQSPDDPLLAARNRYCRSQGGNPFMALSLPQAILTLKQGVGRLLRRRDDRGVMAILDTRLETRRYGRTFLTGLPPVPITRDREQVRQFLGLNRDTGLSEPR